MEHKTGVLSEQGEGTEVLSTSEYECLKSCLDLMRRENDPEAAAIAGAMDRNTFRIRRLGGSSTLEIFLEDACAGLGEHADHVVGIVYSAYSARYRKPILLREDEDGRDRFETLAALNELFERDHWLANFLGVKLKFWLDRNSPVTPGAVIQQLAEQAEIFDADVRDARKMLAAYPNLFKSEKEVA